MKKNKKKQRGKTSTYRNTKANEAKQSAKKIEKMYQNGELSAADAYIKILINVCRLNGLNSKVHLLESIQYKLNNCEINENEALEAVSIIEKQLGNIF